MTVTIDPPGDKSISHRLLMLAPLATGVSTIRGILGADDVGVTESALRQLGVPFRAGRQGEVAIEAPAAWQAPEDEIDCGNSGTSARLLMGLLAGLGMPAVLRGDASLSRRPMDRVVYPLQAMGAGIRYLDCEGHLPVKLEPRRSGALRPLRHRPRTPSAQVKSCLLLAALTGGVRVEVLEAAATRDHTERLLEAMGAPISVDRTMDREGAVISLRGDEDRRGLSPLDVAVPGDFSSAAFLLAAAWLGAGSVVVREVGLNPTRTALLEVAGRMGARFEAGVSGSEAGEPVGEVRAVPSRLLALQVGPDLLPGLVDEVPVLAVLAARAEGVSRIRGAGELRVKETDRLAVLAENLRVVGVGCTEHEDGLDIEGTDRRLAGLARSHGDHRIAMAFGVLGAAPGCEIAVEDPGCVSVSYPSFWRDLRRMTGPETV